MGNAYLRKLGVEEWLVSAVMSSYTGAKTVVRTVYGNSSSFEVKVGMHQGSTLSPLLFVIVMEAVSREFRVALPSELLYADDLVVIAETEEDLIKRLNEWKNNVENRGVGVNMNKTKVMISGERQKPLQKAARWPCGVCGRGVGSNSIRCASCHKWVHKMCSGIKGSMYKVMRSFICRGCLNPVISTGHTSMDIGASANLEFVDKFCYVGDMLSVDGDADAAVEARIRIGWNKFRQLVPLLANRENQPLDILWCSVCLSLTFVTFFVKKYFLAHINSNKVYFKFILFLSIAALRVCVKDRHSFTESWRACTGGCTGDSPVAACIGDSRDRI